MSGGPEAGLAIVLRLDAATEATLEPVARGLPWPPHLTLAVLDAATAEPPVLRALAGLAASWSPLPVVLASLGRFPGGVRFLAPVPTPALPARHAALLAALGGPPVHPHHRPDAWVPHVSVAGEAALELLPLRAVLESLELVRFPPAWSLGRWAL